MSEAVSRKIIYLLLIAVIACPLLFGLELTPAKMDSSEKVFTIIEDLPSESKDAYALLALDFGPGTQAENEPQAEVVIEHLFRKKIPAVIFTGYSLGERFSMETPQKVADKLAKEMPGQKWEYGTDWIGLGYKPGGALFLQAFAQAQSLTEYLGKDAKGVLVSRYPRFAMLKDIKNIKFAGEFTGLTGMLGGYIQFLQRADYVPPLIHGCTSITIPEAYIYLDSGQLKGAFEGIAGAAWYGELLNRKFSKRLPGDAIVINTALGAAHLLIIVLIIVGNITTLRRSGG